MKRQIDTKSALETLKYWRDTNTENGVTWVPDYVLDNILQSTTGDVEQVTRCKDCKFCDHIGGTLYCTEIGRNVDEDFFCAYCLERMGGQR